MAGMLDINVGLKPSILRPFEELRSSLGKLAPIQKELAEELFGKA